MIVVEKNEGTKIDYTVSKTKITFDDQIMLKLDRFEKDWPVHKDICIDRDGDLTIGVGEGLYYVAEIDIPARQYEEQEETDTSDSEEGFHDGLSEGGSAPVAKPFSMDNVMLTLWSLDDLTEAVTEEEEE